MLSNQTHTNMITDAISTLSGKEILLSCPVPAKTDSYSPVPHRVVMETIYEVLDKNNIKVTGERYIAAREGRQGIAYLDIQGGDETMSSKLAWNNSYDKSLTLKAAAGANVFVCGNGMVRGDLGNFKRRHTGSILEEFKTNIVEYIGNIDKQFKQLVIDRERMKEVELTKRVTAELLGRMFIEEGIITNTQLGIIKREIEIPTFDYKADGTLWQLYNHCTFSMKEAHPTLAIQSHIDLHKFVINEFELV